MLHPSISGSEKEGTLESTNSLPGYWLGTDYAQEAFSRERECTWIAMLVPYVSIVQKNHVYTCSLDAVLARPAGTS